jgi:membrane-associated protein
MELVQHGLDLCLKLVDVFLHLDVYLGEMAQWMGPWLYVLLFVVIFCETGLVVTPILPGDSLLFAAGALAALPDSPLNVHALALLLFIGAILGDASNYAIGKRLGPKVFSREKSLLLNKDHLEKARLFYEKHGGKTIIFARFIPIIRTFAPFVAGIGRMGYRRFAAFNVIGAAAWGPPFLYAGYALGNVPSVKLNFHIVIVAIVIISVMPAVFEYMKSRSVARRAAPPV